MPERDWTDGEPWGTDAYDETCNSCGTINRVTVPEGPPGGHETYSVACAKCGAALESIEAFGSPIVRKIKVRGK